MRIVGGTLRGRIIHPPGNFKARPTTDMAKEGLFNILTNRFAFSEISVLDLFSGSGNISYEFASRGCTDITCVEKDLMHFRFIRKTADEFGLNIKVFHLDCFRFIEKPIRQYDLIFADPPFDHPRLNSIPQTIFEKSLLTPGGLFILEHPRNFDFTSYVQFSEERIYGHIVFSFFRKIES